ncbi:MAG: MFS transporter [Candidatus Aminicenantes bacterium]|nr:MFS transporter [Candidatus Aminicenantes bacterium]NIN89850.1 MFS transporter [Candidatus Aminicenantes bacterium]NIO86439.1 MFS transporter [Candidatus Aminicenantes bacterium]NIQ72292.1 MFS transporter [Candidatus Aminicenantes bacterium]NIT28330.1 MFS transporter [Candidatus Aminicenantes bacterium]
MSNKQKRKNRFSKDYIWTFTTYFTEGFPYGMIRSVSSLFFRDMNAPLEFIGLTSLYQLPWTLKFLWGPWVDEYSSKRRWMLTMQPLLLVMLAVAALLTPLDNSIYLIFGLFFVGAIIAATHDIAIDGYYMEALDKDGQAKFVGYRTMAFRIAWMTGTGVIATIGVTAGWFLGFLAAAVIFGLFFLYHIFFLPEVQTRKKKIKVLFSRALDEKPLLLASALIIVVLGVYLFFQSPVYSQLKEQVPLLKKITFSHWIALLLLLGLVLLGIFRKRLKALILRDPESQYSRAFVYFMDRDRIAVILTFIILLRAGEWTLTNMVSPFIVDIGIKIHYGWLSAGVGLPASIVGAILGGWMISRLSLKKVMWPFILAQNFSNLIYMGLALHLSYFLNINQWVVHHPVLLLGLPGYGIVVPLEPLPIGTGNLLLVALTHGFDQFASGLGTAVLMTFLMRICKKEFKAAHYAIGSGLMNVTGIFAGVSSGFIAAWLGYAWLFGISFVASIPAMVLIPFLPYLSDREATKDTKGHEEKKRRRK